MIQSEMWTAREGRAAVAVGDMVEVSEVRYDVRCDNNRANGGVGSV
ncbi:MAG TPA: hypothetical protein VHF51_02430 [Solirubrobacteraceae bacterium]|nr:hypothetical protein [Solirubrobacteraceae bacterium]